MPEANKDKTKQLIHHQINYLLSITWIYRQIPLNTSKSRNFINTKENIYFIIIPEYRLENSQQYTVCTITNYKTNFASGKYGYRATITKMPILIPDNTMRKTILSI